MLMRLGLTVTVLLLAGCGDLPEETKLAVSNETSSDTVEVHVQIIDSGGAVVHEESLTAPRLETVVVTHLVPGDRYVVNVTSGDLHFEEDIQTGRNWDSLWIIIEDERIRWFDLHGD